MASSTASTRRSRSGQWNRCLRYASWVPRPPPLLACSLASGLCLLATLFWSSLPARGPQEVDPFSVDAAFIPARHLMTSKEGENATYYNYKCDRMASSTKGHLSWETCDFETASGSRAPWIALYIGATLVIFVALAIVCDDFFVPSLEAISEKLHLSEDVAGATFMAAGSSAPELFSSIAAVSFDSDAGIGTIAGSAVFNMLVIISLTAAFAGKVLHLDWRPLARDSFFYLVSILFFIYTVSDSVVQLWEAAILLTLYALYIVIMVFNARLMDGLGSLGDWLQRTCIKSEPATVSDEQTNGAAARRVSTYSNASVRSEDMKVFRHDRRNSVVLHIAGAKVPAGQTVPTQQAPKTSTSLHLMPPEPQPGNGLASGKEILPEEDDAHESTPMTEKLDNPRRKSRTGGDRGVEFRDPPAQVIVELQTDATDGTPASNADTEDISSKDECDADKICADATEDEDAVDVEAPEEAETGARMRCCCLPAACPDIRGAPPDKPSDSPSAAELALLALKWLLFVVAFPFLCLFSWTIPECSRDDLKKYFMVSFLVSVLWIAALSFAMVTIVARMGCLMGIDTFVMSLVVLAAGTSIPDLLSSIIVARDGFGDMAVSNAIGSNVFDIDLGLGLPFLIRAIINKGKPLDMFSDSERRTYCENRMKFIPHVKFGVILIVLLALCMAVIAMSRFKLGRFIGVSFFLMYIGFLVYAFCQEFLCNFDC